IFNISVQTDSPIREGQWVDSHVESSGFRRVAAKRLVISAKIQLVESRFALRLNMMRCCRKDSLGDELLQSGPNRGKRAPMMGSRADFTQRGHVFGGAVSGVSLPAEAGVFQRQPVHDPVS